VNRREAILRVRFCEKASKNYEYSRDLILAKYPSSRIFLSHHVDHGVPGIGITKESLPTVAI